MLDRSNARIVRASITKKITQKDIIGLKSLDALIVQNPNVTPCEYSGICNHCGCSVKIDIHKTSVGYGLLGGVLYEPDSKTIVALCPSCQKMVETMK